MRAFIAAIACCLPLACAAARFDAVVSHVTDGDTVWVRPLAGGPPQQVRIEGIDAPEICQAFGERSRDALAARVLRKRVTLLTRGEDDFRRTVARIRLEREDVGGWMVSQGYAWSYRFRRDAGPYRHEERSAQLARRGLWASGSAELPRDFRVRHGPCTAAP
ncbi:thermonuclease family protein [Ramlibacter sp. PS4R-6]|uniref:thermonuclease family protein n=1 Tax=Ramlibacter sp. PS4R-6 TaxID=3133438 RepID=UPI0030AD80C8